MMMMMNTKDIHRQENGDARNNNDDEHNLQQQDFSFLDIDDGTLSVATQQHQVSNQNDDAGFGNENHNFANEKIKLFLESTIADCINNNKNLYHAPSATQQVLDSMLSQLENQNNHNNNNNVNRNENNGNNQHHSFTQNISGNGLTIPFYRQRTVAMDRTPCPTIQYFLKTTSSNAEKKKKLNNYSSQSQTNEGNNDEDEDHLLTSTSSTQPEEQQQILTKEFPALISLDYGLKGAKQFGNFPSRNSILGFISSQQDVSLRNFYVHVDPNLPLDLYFDIDGYFQNQEEIEFWKNLNLFPNSSSNSMMMMSKTPNNQKVVSPFRVACDNLASTVVEGLWRAIQRRLPMLSLYHVACFDACRSSHQQHGGPNSNTNSRNTTDNDDDASNNNKSSKKSSSNINTNNKISFHVHFRLWDPKKDAPAYFGFESVRDFVASLVEDLKNEGNEVDEYRKRELEKEGQNNSANSSISDSNFVSPSKWVQFIDSAVYTNWRAFRLPFNMKKLESGKCGQPLLPRIPRQFKNKIIASLSNNNNNNNNQEENDDDENCYVPAIERTLFDLCSKKSFEDAFAKYSSTSSLEFIENLCQTTLREVSREILSNPLSSYSSIEFDLLLHSSSSSSLTNKNANFDKQQQQQARILLSIFALQFDLSLISRPEYVPFRFFEPVACTDAGLFFNLRRQRNIEETTNSSAALNQEPSSSTMMMMMTVPNNTASTTSIILHEKQQNQLSEMEQNDDKLNDLPPFFELIRGKRILTSLPQTTDHNNNRQQYVGQQAGNANTSNTLAASNLSTIGNNNQFTSYGIAYHQMPNVPFAEIPEWDRRHIVIRNIFKSLHPQYSQNLGKLRVQFGDNGYLRMYYVYQKSSKFCPIVGRDHKVSFPSLYITYGSVKVKCYSNDCHNKSCPVYPFIDLTKREEYEARKKEAQEMELRKQQDGSVPVESNSSKRQQQQQQAQVTMMWDNPALFIDKRNVLFPELTQDEVIRRYAPVSVAVASEKGRQQNVEAAKNRDQEEEKMLRQMAAEVDHENTAQSFMMTQQPQQQHLQDISNQE